MSSFLRTLQRRQLRKSTDYETPTQLAQPQPDGGYRVLHPTRGWKTVCGKRAALYL